MSPPEWIPPAAETLESQGTEDVLSNEDLTEAAAAGLRWIAYARLAIELMLFATMVVLARLIPPAAFGIFAVVTIVQELALMMPMEGIGGALVQRRSIDRDHLRGGLFLSLSLSLLLAGIVALLAVTVIEPLLGHRTELLTLATTPYFLLGAIYALPMAVLRRRLDFRRLSIIDLSLNGSRALASLALALAGLDAPALVFGSMAGMAVALCLALAFAPVPLPRWRPRAMRDLLPYGGPAALATISWTGFRNGDYAIIGAVLGPAQAGFYWRSYQLAVEYQGKVANAVSQVAFPVLARTEGIEELLVLRQRMVRLLAVLVFPLLALLILLAPTLIPWLFGAAWAPAVVPTQILVAGGAATLAINTCGSALMAAGRARALLFYGVAHFVVYAGAVLVVARLGIAAVAVAGAVVHGLFLLVAYFVLLRGRAERPAVVLWHDLAPALTACAALAATAVPTYMGLQAIGLSPLPLMSVVAGAGAAGYLVALRVCFPSSAGDLRSAVGRLLPARFSPRRRFGQAVPAEG